MRNNAGKGLPRPARHTLKIFCRLRFYSLYQGAHFTFFYHSSSGNFMAAKNCKELSSHFFTFIIFFQGSNLSLSKFVKFQGSDMVLFKKALHYRIKIILGSPTRRSCIILCSCRYLSGFINELFSKCINLISIIV